MGLFYKKSTKAQVVEDIHLIKGNTQYIDILLVYCKENESLTNELVALQEKIKYLNPCDNEKVQKMDQKIKAKLEECKTLLSQSNSNDFSTIAPLLREIEILVAERNAIII